MSLSLDNFRQVISPEIVQRGRDYFNKGHVQELDEVDEGYWQAEVTGSYPYSVEIRSNPNGSLEHSCNCLYDWGPVCKHVTAVLFAIEENFPEYLKTPKKAKKQRKKRETKAEKLNRILENAQFEELSEILKELALNDRLLYNQIVLHFDEAGNKGKYVRMVKDAMKSGQGEYGFIDYWGSDRAANAVQVILSEAISFLKDGQVEKAIPIFQAILETVTPALSHADDSNGSLGYCISNSVECLKEASQKISGKPRTELFEYFLRMAKNKELQAWDWGWDVAQIAAGMTQTHGERQQVFTALDYLARSQNSEKSDFSKQFDLDKIQQTKLLIIEREDSSQEIEQFIIENLDVFNFREKLIHFYLQHDRLEEAKQSCREFLNKLPNRYFRNKAAFLEPLLKIAEMEGDDDQVLQIAEELFYATQKFQYFDLLKEKTSDQSWEETFKRILSKVIPDLLLEIYVREEMWDDLLASAQNMSKYSIDHYRFYLEKYFPKETCKIYSRIIYEELATASNRKAYRKACQYLKRFRKLGQEEKMVLIIDDLRDRYNRRPALLDELSKI